MGVNILFTCIISLMPLTTPVAYLSASYSTNRPASVANSAMVFVSSVPWYVALFSSRAITPKEIRSLGHNLGEATSFSSCVTDKLLTKLGVVFSQSKKIVTEIWTVATNGAPLWMQLKLKQLIFRPWTCLHDHQITSTTIKLLQQQKFTHSFFHVSVDDLKERWC